MRAVVWTDALQVGVMVAAVIVITGLGTFQVGGFSEVWQRAIEANRIEFFKYVLKWILFYDSYINWNWLLLNVYINLYEL